MGYHRAGFEVVGVDVKPQPNYPFEFCEADALTVLDYAWWRQHEEQELFQALVEPFHAIHASPPCQAYSAGARMRLGHAKDHPKLIEPVRELLRETGLPYVIENVPEAPLDHPIRLCGSSFGITAIEGVRRHRAFESNVALLAPACAHGVHSVVVGVYGDHPEDSVIRKGHPAIRARDVAHAQRVMGIDWSESWAELKETIPPAYTELIGHQLMQHIRATPVLASAGKEAQ